MIASTSGKGPKLSLIRDCFLIPERHTVSMLKAAILEQKQKKSNNFFFEIFYII